MKYGIEGGEGEMYSQILQLQRTFDVTSYFI
jgi:hypothetical protein